MKVTSFRPMLRTWKMRETIEFYTSVLGFECRAFAEELGWASLARQGAELMLCGPNDHLHETAPAFTGSFYFNVADVDAVWAELRGKAKVCYEIESFDFGMREFGIFDNNGYLLQFGQEVHRGRRPG